MSTPAPRTPSASTRRTGATTPNARTPCGSRSGSWTSGDETRELPDGEFGHVSSGSSARQGVATVHLLEVGLEFLLKLTKAVTCRHLRGPVGVQGVERAGQEARRAQRRVPVG